MQEFQLYFAIQDTIYPRVDDQFDSLNDAERTFFLIDWLDMQVHNGGFHQWYFNWSSADRQARVEDTLDALEVIGAADTVTLVERAVALLATFPAPDDPRLIELDDLFWDRPDELTGLTQAWAEEHIDQFSVTPPP